MGDKRYRVGGAMGLPHKGVFFTEKIPENAEMLSECSTSSDVQNTNIETLKDRLAEQVLSAGGNVLANFKYSQRGTIWSFSSVRWEASGTAAKVASIEHDESAGPLPGAQKQCPHCAETVLAAAKKCKHCGESI
jgi:ribosomal protein S27AE